MRKTVGLDRLVEPAPTGVQRNLVGSRPRPIKSTEKPKRRRKKK